MNRLLARAQRALRTAEHLLDYGDSVAAGSRAYYAVFDAMRAVLQESGIDYTKIKTHHGLMLSFEQNVVRPGKLDRDVAAAILKAAELRRVSDYEPEIDVAPEEARNTLDTIRSFIEACAKLIGDAGNAEIDNKKGAP